MSDYLQSFLDRCDETPFGGFGGLVPSCVNREVQPPTCVVRDPPKPPEVDAPSQTSASPNPPEPPKGAEALDSDLSLREVVRFPAALVFELPLPIVLTVTVDGLQDPVTIGPGATFDPREWLALVQLSEAGRAERGLLKAWAENKRCGSTAQLRAPDAAHRGRGWTVCDVLTYLGASVSSLDWERAG